MGQSTSEAWGTKFLRGAFIITSVALFFSVTIFLVRAINGQAQYTATDPSSIAEAKVTALTNSPTSDVPGKTFDRFVTIWLENQDYDIAAGDPNLEWLASQGITLTQYYALTHPSQPNYVAAIGGDTHDVYDDEFFRIDFNVITLIDLLEAKGVSWSEYQEDMPYTGFEGDYVNQVTGANDYMRKHNPVMSYDSVTLKPDRLARVKNFTMFYQDLESDKLPQWMFITPNMTNDGHDTSVTVAGQWARDFLTPLLSNSNFMKKTLVLLTFDESESYILPNRVFSVLLGDAVPADQAGTEDNTKYDHYSQLATVEKNWDLGSLGEGDVDAVPFY